MLMNQQNAIGRGQLKNGSELAVHSAKMKIAFQATSMFESLNKKAQTCTVHECHELAVDPDVGSCLVEKFDNLAEEIRACVFVQYS